MLITWHGQSCFKIQGEKCAVVTDPFGNDYGLKLPRLTADVVTISHDHNDHNNIAGVKGVGEEDPFLINAPGEYEVKNTFFYGITSFHDAQGGKERGSNIIYLIEMEGIKIAHLGDLGHQLANGQIERLEGVDIIMIPVGGSYTIDARQATEIISQLEPRIVIPMHYQLPGLKTKLALDGVEKFCKEIGVSAKETVTKYKITKKDLPSEDLQVVVMEP